MTKLYNDYNSYLKAKYGCKVYRIGLDAGFTCPTRDGTKGSSGCLYCNETGSRSSYTNPREGISSQLSSRIKYLQETKGAKKFIAYFQAFTNTYAPPDKLKTIYDEVLPFDDIVSISIGTRPDAIDREKLHLISSYKNKYEVWIEYGLQTIRDSTLNHMNRGHSFKDFLNALDITKKFDIPVCVHVILGLPGERRSDIIDTAKMLSSLKVNGVKIHVLHVLRGSGLEKLYEEGKIKILEENEYVELVCDFLENLSGDIIVQRLTGQGTAESHAAPAWALDKTKTLKKITEILKKRGTYQGSGVKERLKTIS